MDINLTRKMLTIGLLLVGIFVFGTVGYVLIEGPHQNMSAFDAFYLTVITLTTIGFGEIPGQLSTGGRILTIILAFSGMGMLLYAVSNVTAFFVEGHLNHLLTKRKMDRMIKEMKNHYIVCGSGQMARHVCEELERTLTPFVIIDGDENQLKKTAEELPGIAYRVGDVSDDAVLIECGIERAQGLVSVQPSDQDNLFTIITARRLNPSIRIISVAVAESAIPKLRYAGADGVVSPNLIGSMRMVSELIRPATVSFLDRMLKDKNHDWRIGEATVHDGSSFVGTRLRDIQARLSGPLLVLAVKRAGADGIEYIPPADLAFSVGDTIFVLAPAKSLESLRTICGIA